MRWPDEVRSRSQLPLRTKCLHESLKAVTTAFGPTFLPWALPSTVKAMGSATCGSFAEACRGRPSEIQVQIFRSAQVSDMPILFTGPIFLHQYCGVCGVRSERGRSLCRSLRVQCWHRDSTCICEVIHGRVSSSEPTLSCESPRQLHVRRRLWPEVSIRRKILTRMLFRMNLSSTTPCASGSRKSCRPRFNHQL